MRCEECKSAPEGTAKGWRAYLTGDGVAIYCPKCALREFGPRFASRFARPSYLVALLIISDLGKEVYVGDWWRTLAFVAVVAMYAGLRDELTKTNP